MRTSRSMVWPAAVAAACLCLGTVAHGGLVLSGGGLVLVEEGGTFDANNLALNEPLNVVPFVANAWNWSMSLAALNLWSRFSNLSSLCE